MKVPHSLGTSANTHPKTQHHNPENINIQQSVVLHRENHLSDSRPMPHIT